MSGSGRLIGITVGAVDAMSDTVLSGGVDVAARRTEMSRPAEILVPDLAGQPTPGSHPNAT